MISWISNDGEAVDRSFCDQLPFKVQCNHIFVYRVQSSIHVCCEWGRKCVVSYTWGLLRKCLCVCAVCVCACMCACVWPRYVSSSHHVLQLFMALFSIILVSDLVSDGSHHSCRRIVYCTHTLTHTRTHTHSHTYTHTHTLTHTHTHTHTHVHTHTHTHVHTHTLTHTHTHTHTLTHTCVHTHTHTHSHTHTVGIPSPLRPPNLFTETIISPFPPTPTHHPQLEGMTLSHHIPLCGDVGGHILH